LAEFLSANAFSVYVFHPPIVIMIARSLHGISMPALVKIAVLTGLSAVAAFTLSDTVLRRLPLLREIL
jgi:surface polysaccharide O-acyltransferase-like enzyme